MKLKKLFIEKPEILQHSSRQQAIGKKRWRVWSSEGCVYLGDIVLLMDGKTYKLSPSIKFEQHMYTREGDNMRYNPHHIAAEPILTTDRKQVRPLFKKAIKDFISSLIYEEYGALWSQ